MNTEKIEQAKFGDILIYSNTKGSATIKQGSDVIVIVQDNIPKAISALGLLSTPVEDKVEVSDKKPIIYAAQLEELLMKYQNETGSSMAHLIHWLSHRIAPTPAPVKEVKALSEISDEDAIEVAKILIEKYNAYDFSCVLLNVDEKFKTLELVPNDYYKNLKMATKQIDFRLNCDIVIWKMHAKSPWSMHDSDEIENYPLPQYLKSIDFLRSRGYDIPNSYTL